MTEAARKSLSERETVIKKKMQDAARKVIRRLGGPSTAVMIFEKVLGRQIGKVSVSNWVRNGVPAKWAEDIYDLTEIPPWITNPEIFTRVGVRREYKPKQSRLRKADRILLAIRSGEKAKEPLKKKVAKKKTVKKKISRLSTSEPGMDRL